MLKSAPFEVALADKQSIILPNSHIRPFVENKHKRIRVKAVHDGSCIEFYAALKREKSGLHRIYFSKAKQKDIGVFLNDYFMIQIFEDTSKYGAEVPEELEAVLLSDHDAYTIFESLTEGKKRSIIYAIARYRSAQTRIDKALILTESLKRGNTDPKSWLKRN